jgi:hypothetical protein
VQAGNTAANARLEHAVPAATLKPAANAPPGERAAYVSRKYAEKAFSSAAQGGAPAPPALAPPSTEAGAVQDEAEVPPVGKLTMKLVEAKDVVELAPDAANGTSAYCKFYLGGSYARSRVAEHAENAPSWQEDVEVAWDGKSNLVIELWHWEEEGADTCMGTIELALAPTPAVYMQVMSNPALLILDVRDSPPELRPNGKTCHEQKDVWADVLFNKAVAQGRLQAYVDSQFAGKRTSSVLLKSASLHLNMELQLWQQ